MTAKSATTRRRAPSTPVKEAPAPTSSKIQEALDWAHGLGADEAVIELEKLVQHGKLTHQQRALLLVCATRLGGIQGFVQTKKLSPDVVYAQSPAPDERHYARIFKTR